MSDDLLMVCRCGLEYLCGSIAEADAWLRTHEHKPQDGQLSMLAVTEAQLKLKEGGDD